MVNEGSVGTDWIIVHLHQFGSNGGFDFVVVRDAFQRRLRFFDDAESQRRVQIVD